MSLENNSLHLPSHCSFEAAIAGLSLPYSGSELHGMMCGYLCAAAVNEGEAYLRLLLGWQKDEPTRSAALALFELYSISQQQISCFTFDFQLLLPEEHEPLRDRAKAFSEWCYGFTQGLQSGGIYIDRLQDEEAQDALHHMAKFAELDYGALEVNEEDEKAFMEVTEYARMAVLRLHTEVCSQDQRPNSNGIAH